MAISTVSAEIDIFTRLYCVVLTKSAIILFNDKERKVAEEVVHRMVKRAVEMEGTVTGEHGVGLIKRDYLAHETSEATVDAMRKVSHFFLAVGSLLMYSGVAQAGVRPTVHTKLR